MTELGFDNISQVDGHKVAAERAVWFDREGSPCITYSCSQQEMDSHSLGPNSMH